MRPTLPALDELQSHPLAVSFNQLVAKYPNYALAVSGGADSMCLMLLSKALGHRPKVLHVNHGMQAESSSFEAHVKAQASRFGFEYEVAVLNLGSANEAQAREARLKAFARMSNGVVLTGHHLNDQLETLLMNLARGSGLDGLCGVQAAQRLSVDQAQLLLLRPFLSTSKDTLCELLVKHQLTWVEDPTNREPKANLRAKIRSTLTPALLEVLPQSLSGVARSVQLLTEAKDALAELLESDIQAAQTSPASLSVPVLCAISSARRRQLLAAFMKTGVYLPPRARVLEVEQSVLAQTHKTPVVSFNGFEYRRYQSRLYRVDPLTLEAPDPRRLKLQLGSRFNAAGMSFEVTPSKSGLSQALLDQEFELAPVAQGSRLRLAHRAGSWPIKKIHQELKVAPWLRPLSVLLIQNNTPLMLLAHGHAKPLVSTHFTDPKDLESAASDNQALRCFDVVAVKSSV